MSVTLRNFVKLQGSRQLLPEMCLKRLQSTCKDTGEMTPERKRFKALQAKMQRDIHAPVFLVMGKRDKILYNFTLGLVGFGVLSSLYTVYTFTQRPV